MNFTNLGKQIEHRLQTLYSLELDTSTISEQFIVAIPLKIPIWRFGSLKQNVSSNASKSLIPVIQILMGSKLVLILPCPQSGRLKNVDETSTLLLLISK